MQSICSDIDGQFSASVNFSTTGDPLPGNWTGANVGSTGNFGSQCFLSATGTYSVVGGGSISSTTTDGFRFIYATLTGNGSIIAKVNSLTTTNNNKAGVMIRESLANNARHASSLVVRASGAWRRQFVRRTSTGGTATITQPNNTTTPPYWVRIVRSGNTFTASVSSNGTSWTQISSATISMANTTYIGLAVASGSTTSSATASISNVSTTGTVSFAGAAEERSENTHISIVESTAKPRLEVFPNPGVDRLNVKLRLSEQAKVDLQVTDMLGRLVLQLPVQQVAAGDSFQAIEISPLMSDGIYLVKCSVNGQPPAVVRWVKNGGGY